MQSARTATTTERVPATPPPPVVGHPPHHRHPPVTTRARQGQAATPTATPRQRHAAACCHWARTPWRATWQGRCCASHALLTTCRLLQLRRRRRQRVTRWCCAPASATTRPLPSLHLRAAATAQRRHLPAPRQTPRALLAARAARASAVVAARLLQEWRQVVPRATPCRCACATAAGVSSLGWRRTQGWRVAPPQQRQRQQRWRPHRQPHPAACPARQGRPAGLTASR